MKRWIAYTRVSKVGERGDDLISPDLQRREIEAYASRRGDAVIEVVEDLDETGRSFERRKVKDLVARIEGGEADGILLWKWSRWGRNQQQSLLYLTLVDAAGGEVRAVTEDFDQQTAFGRYSRNNLLAMAELQSDQISEGWKEVHARRRDLGLAHGGPVPFGYRKADRRDAPPVPDPVTGPIVIGWYERYLAGVGPRTMVNEANAAGIRTTRGKSWSLSPLIRQLDSGFAAGYLRVGGELVRGSHPPLIDEHTWRAYLRERERRRVVHPKQRQPERWPFGGGLTVCADCGGPMSLNRYDEPSYARCSRRLHQGSSYCPGNEIKRVKVDSVIALWLLGRGRELTDVADAARDVEGTRKRLSQALDDLRVRTDRIQAGRATAAGLVARGDMNETDYLAAKAETDRELAEIGRRSADTEAEIAALDPDRDTFERLIAAYDHLSNPEWNRQLKQVIREVRVGREQITLVPWHGEPATWDRAGLQPDGARKRGPNGRFVR